MARNESFLRGFGGRALLKDLGVRADHVLRRAGLPADLLPRPGQGLSTEGYFGFWRSLEAEVGDPLFALRIVETVSTESFEPPLFAALCSTHLAQAAQRLAKYKQLMAPMMLEMTVNGRGDLTLSPRWLAAKGDVPPSMELAEVGFLVRLARIATREPVRALRVTLPRLPEVEPDGSTDWSVPAEARPSTAALTDARPCDTPSRLPVSSSSSPPADRCLRTRPRATCRRCRRGTCRRPRAPGRWSRPRARGPSPRS